MIFTMIGGGAHRLLSTVRGALNEGAFREGGELRYYDLDTSRSQAMAEMIQKSPEFRKNPAPVAVKWDLTLEQALEGADVVSVTLLAGGGYTMSLCNELGWSYGYLGSDNVSYPGAFLALRGAPILMNIARTMERVCPNAVLLDFANPVAVLSGMVNMFTKIRAYGVCEGHNNHCFDFTRILQGKDAYDPDYDVYVAGINHCSFVCRGTYHGEDLLKLFDRRFKEVPDWADRIPFNPLTRDVVRTSILGGLRDIERLYLHRGALLFSSEGDGSDHYFMEDALRNHAELPAWDGLMHEVPTHNGELLDERFMQDIRERSERDRQGRLAANKEFAEFAALPADEIPWNDPARHIFHIVSKGDVQCRVLCGLAGVEKTRVAVSDLNNGAVSNMAKGLTMEFSHEVDKNGLHPIDGLEVPFGVLGMTTTLAAHQTALAYACGTEDPHDLYKALLMYPVKFDTADARELWGKLLTASKGMIAPSFEGLRAYL